MTKRVKKDYIEKRGCSTARLDIVYNREYIRGWIQQWKHAIEVEDNLKRLQEYRQPTRTGIDIKTASNPRNQEDHQRDEEWQSAWSRWHQC